MPTNASLINKIDLTVANLQANGGYLPEEATKEFLELTIEQSVVLQDLRFEPMNAEKKKVAAAHFTGRIARAGTSHQALPTSDRVALNTAKADLTSVEVVAEAFIGDDELDNNIEQEELETTVKDRMAKRFGYDLEELVVNGDTALADTYLALLDGMIKKATTNIHDAGTAAPSDATFTSLMLKLPKPVRRTRSEVRCYMGGDAHARYAATVAARQDSKGVVVHTEGGKLLYLGIEIVPTDVIKEDLGGGSNTTIALMLHPKNGVYGIQRQIRIEAQRDARARGTYWVVTAKPAFDYIHEPHVAKQINILAT